MDICVRSGDVDRAYNLLKNPTFLPASASLGNPSSDVSAAPSAVAARAGTADISPGGSLEAGTADDLGEVGKGGTTIVDEDAVGQKEDDVGGLLSLLSNGVRGGDGTTGSASMNRTLSALNSEALTAGDVEADEMRLPSGLIDPTEAAPAPPAPAPAAATAVVMTLEAGVEEGAERIPSSSVDAVAGKERLEAENSGDGGEGPYEGGDRGKLVRPSVEAFTSVLTGFAGVGDKDRALAVFQQVRRSRTPPPKPRPRRFLLGGGGVRFPPYMSKILRKK